MDDREAYEFYLNPENLIPAGPPRKRKAEARRRTAMMSIRFTPDELATVQGRAAEAGMLVSAYLRALALGRPTGLIPGSGRAGDRKALFWSPTDTTATVNMGGGRSFRCPHLSIGNVDSAYCATCGSLSATA